MTREDVGFTLFLVLFVGAVAYHFLLRKRVSQNVNDNVGIASSAAVTGIECMLQEWFFAVGWTLYTAYLLREYYQRKAKEKKSPVKEEAAEPEKEKDGA